MVDVAPSGVGLLDRLRAKGVPRPPLDGELPSRLRSHLERAALAATDLPPGVTIMVTKDRLRRVLTCERHLLATIRSSSRQTPEMVRGLLLDHLFAQLVAGCPVGERPVEEALAAADTAGDPRLRAAWEALGPDDREELLYTVPVLARELAARWPALPANAWVRLQEPLGVYLADGRVRLSGRVDLVLGQPAQERAGTTLLDVKSGNRRLADQQDAAWYALLDTLRSRAAPFQVGNYYLQDGSLSLEVVTPDLLVREAGRVAEGITRLVRLQAGGTPAVTPSPLCPWCPALPGCGPGRQSSEDDGYTVADPPEEGSS